MACVGPRSGQTSFSGVVVMFCCVRIEMLTVPQQQPAQFAYNFVRSFTGLYHKRKSPIDSKLGFPRTTSGRNVQFALSRCVLGRVFVRMIHWQEWVQFEYNFVSSFTGSYNKRKLPIDSKLGFPRTTSGRNVQFALSRCVLGRVFERMIRWQEPAQT
jgi:hypothetical protein